MPPLIISGECLLRLIRDSRRPQAHCRRRPHSGCPSSRPWPAQLASRHEPLLEMLVIAAVAASIWTPASATDAAASSPSSTSTQTTKPCVPDSTEPSGPCERQYAMPPPISSGESTAAKGFEPAIECRSNQIDIVAGSQARVGSRYRTTTGLTATAPPLPASWTVQRCTSGSVIFVHPDAATKMFLTAMASDVGIAPWTDEQSFQRQVRQIISTSMPKGLRFQIDHVTATTLDGRPCLDVRASGTIDALRGADGSVVGPLLARQFFRACHLRDRRGAEAGVLIAFQSTGAGELPAFDAAARSFVDGVDLPGWVR